MENVLKIIIILIGLGLFICLFKNILKQLKKYILILLIYIINVIIIFNIINKIFFNYFIIDFFKIIDILLISMSISLILSIIWLKIIRKLEEYIFIKKHEKPFEYFNFIYYRDLISISSPAMLAYCYNKKINIKDIIVATILSLKLKNVIIIDIDNNLIKLKENINNYKIYKHELMIIDYFNSVQIEKYFEMDFIVQLEKDLCQDNFIYKEDPKYFKSAYILELFMGWIILFCLLYFFIIGILFQKEEYIIFTAISYFITFAIFPIYKLLQKKVNIFVRKKRTGN